jgi:hypothetical protein
VEEEDIGYQHSVKLHDTPFNSVVKEVQSNHYFSFSLVKSVIIFSCEKNHSLIPVKDISLS